MTKVHRKINATAFKRQMAEQVVAPDSLIEVQVNEQDSVLVKIPFNLDEGDDYRSAIAACSTGEEIALVMLGFHQSLSAEEQWAKWTDAGHDAKLLTNIVGNAVQEAEEKAKNFRYRG